MTQHGTGAKARKGVKRTGQTALAEREGRREWMLSRIEQVRASQRAEGNFDCFGTAASGYCDRGDCVYHAECLSLSLLAATPFP